MNADQDQKGLLGQRNLYTNLLLITTTIITNKVKNDPIRYIILINVIFDIVYVYIKIIISNLTALFQIITVELPIIILIYINIPQTPLAC